MPIDPFIPSASNARRNGSMFIQMRAQMDDLQRQLATGQKAASFGDLGVGRRVSVDSRAKINTLEGWTKAIDQGNTRIAFMMQSIEGISKNALDGKSDARPGAYVQGANGQVAGQLLARDRLSQSIDMLNIEVGGRYLFSGRSHDVKPVESFDVIMKDIGSPGLAGVKTLISERQQADAGVGNLGRLTSTLAGATLTVANDATIALNPATGNPEYGFTIASASSSTTTIAATLVAGPPASAAFNVAANPAAGDRVTLALTLPDGTAKTIELEARLQSVGGPAETGFSIGATPAATAANLAAAVSAALQKETATSLNAASATIAARDFFNGSTTNPPRRVPGPGFATATALPATPVPNTTVIWYKGDDDAAIQARNTGAIQVDNGQTVATGARANEQAFVESLVGFTVFATTNFSAADPNSRDRYEAMADRVRSTLSFSATQKPQDIGLEIATAQISMKSAKDRHKVSANFYETARSGVEDASQEEVAATILSLRTRLEASYQTTSILSRLSLVNYIN
jgi:flagellin-like hook-associated protein FlgL